MPSRWLVSLAGIVPERVDLHHVHAAFSRWFDATDTDHRANEKPFTLSPLTDGPSGAAVEVATLHEGASDALMRATSPGASVRLGSQRGEVISVMLMHEESWADLATWSGHDLWRLEFLTPVTFRNRDRSSPLPDTGTITKSLAQAWRSWSPLTLPEVPATWVSDLDLVSQVLQITTGRSHGGQQQLTISASIGSIAIRSAGAPYVPDALLRLAAYTGIGSFTRKGLGVTRVNALRARQP